MRIVNYHYADFYYLIFMRVVNYHSFFDRREEEEERKEKEKKEEVMNRRVIEKIFLGALRPQKPYRFYRRGKNRRGTESPSSLFTQLLGSDTVTTVS